MANQITACHVLRLLTSGGDLVWLVPTKFVLGQMFVNPPTGRGKSQCYAAVPFVFDALRETSARAAADRSLPSSPVVLFRHEYARELQTLRQRPSIVHNFCQTYFFRVRLGTRLIDYVHHTSTPLCSGSATENIMTHQTHRHN